MNLKDIDPISNPTVSIKQPSIELKTLNLITRLQMALALEEETLCDILEVTETELGRIRSRRQPLTLTQAHRLSEHFGFSLQALQEDRVDFDCLKLRYLKGFDAIPEKYLKSAFSKKRLIKTVVDYITTHYHWSLKEQMLHYFQIHSIPTSNLDDPINVYLFEDILQYLRKSGFSEANLYKIGEQSIETSRGTIFHKRLSEFKTPEEMFTCYFEEMISFIEKNNRYRISKISAYSCTVESHEIPDLLDAFQVSHIAGKNRCIYRAGALSAVTRYIGYPDSQVTEIRCAHEGNSPCTFEIRFTPLPRRISSYDQKK